MLQQFLLKDKFQLRLWQIMLEFILKNKLLFFKLMFNREVTQSISIILIKKICT